MQNRYVGDIGDFGKYGLLRAISGDPLRLGVVWYLFPDEPPKEPGKGDGKFIDYLCNPKPRDSKLRDCDSYLYDELLKIVIQEKDRKVEKIQESQILSDNTLYYEESLSYEPGESQFSKKRRRENWLNSTLEATKEADLVFVDPDNGIAPEKVRPLHKNGPKYVLLEDLRQFYVQGNSLVIYHHLGRHGKAQEQISKLAKRLQESLKLPHMPWSLWYHRGTARVYFIVARERHRAVLEKRLASFADSPWCAKPLSHFELVKPSEG